jgi:hypothetical protein
MERRGTPDMEPPSSFRVVTSPSLDTMTFTPDSPTYSPTNTSPRTTNRLRSAPGGISVNGAVNGNSIIPLGPAGTRCEYKRVDYLFNGQLGSWIYRDTAPFTGQEVGVYCSNARIRLLTFCIPDGRWLSRLLFHHQEDVRAQHFEIRNQHRYQERNPTGCLRQGHWGHSSRIISHPRGRCM